MKTFHGLISVQLFPLYQIAMLLTFEEWCMSFGNVMKTKMMTRHFKCNFNFETSISHHLSSFCHQSLIKLERDKATSFVILLLLSKNTAVPPQAAFYAHIQSTFDFLNALARQPAPSSYFQGWIYQIYICCASFFLFVTFLNRKYVFLGIEISDF